MLKKLPKISLILMLIITVVEIICIAAPSVPGPANLSWNVWIGVWGMYAAVLVGTVIFVKTGK